MTHTEGTFEQIDLDLDGAASIAGQVFDGQGRPVSSVHVRWLRADDVMAFRANGDWAEAATDAAGRYEVRPLVGGGPYRVEVRRAPLAAVLFAPLSRFPAVTLPDGDSHERDVVLRVDTAGFSISGRTVMSGGGSPLSDIKLIALPSGARFLPGYSDCPTALSATDGSFTLDGLSAGGFDVQATSPSGVIVKVPGIPAGTTGVVVELPPSGSIEGALRGFATPPVVFATQRGCEIARAGDCIRVLAAERGAEFKIGGLTPGWYRVQAENPGEAAEAIVEVSAGATTKVALQAHTAASVDGSPVAE